MSIQRSDSAYSSATKSTKPLTSIMPSRKKNSFLGGLFAKEPTLIALAQVEADLKAKHGAATPQKVPHVSSRKMPEHVPKVNSRWDGIPEVVKQRERDEKQRRRDSHRNSTIAPTGLQIENVEGLMNRGSDGLRRPSDTGSTGEEVWYGQGGNVYGRNMIATGQSESSGDSRRSSIRDITSAHSQSFRSPSGTSLPEITSFFPHHNEATPSPRIDRWQSHKSSSTQPISTSHQSPSDLSSASCLDSSIDGTTEHSYSAATDPRELSPTSPFGNTGMQIAYENEKQVAHDTEKQVVPDSGKQTVGVRNFSKPSTKRSVKPTKAVAIDAFLAGEAKPLQLDDNENEEIEVSSYSDLASRPHAQSRTTKADSSTRREVSKRRYGLIMNTSPNADVVPWEASELANTTRTNTMPSPLMNEPSRSRFPKKLTTLK